MAKKANGSQTHSSKSKRKVVEIDIVKEEIGRTIHEQFELSNNLKTLSSHGLLKALEYYGSSSFFRRLTRESLQEKTSMVEYMLDQGPFKALLHSFDIEATPPIEQIFLESGSTISLLAGAFAERLHLISKSDQKGNQKKKLPLSVCTNNFWALTALADLVRDVVVTRGRLGTSSYGFVPFLDDQPTDDTEVLNELKRLRAFVEGVQDCSLYCSSCHRFGFLTGPFTASRRNAMMQRTIHVAYSHKERPTEALYLLFSFDKLIGLLPPGTGMSHANVESVPDDAYSIFIPKRGLCDAVKSISDTNVPISPSIQVWLENYESGECKTPSGIFADKGSQLEDYAWAMQYIDLIGNQSWLEYLNEVKNVHLVVGLKGKLGIDYQKQLEAQIDWLQKEVEIANNVIAQFKKPKINTKFHIVDSDIKNVMACQCVEIRVMARDHDLFD